VLDVVTAWADEQTINGDQPVEAVTQEIVDKLRASTSGRPMGA
jgi:hypothetical protein